MLSGAQTGVKHVALTMGSQGAALCVLSSCGKKVEAQHVPAVPASIVNTSGAGDCLVAGTLACLVQGATPIEALALGLVRFAVLCTQRYPVLWLLIAYQCRHLCLVSCVARELFLANVVTGLQVAAKQALECEDNVPSELSLQKLLPAADDLLQHCQTLSLQAGSPEPKL